MDKNTSVSTGCFRVPSVLASVFRAPTIASAQGAIFSICVCAAASLSPALFLRQYAFASPQLLLFMHLLSLVAAFRLYLAFKLVGSILKLLLCEYLSDTPALILFVKCALSHVHKPCVRPTLHQHLQQMRSWPPCIGPSVAFILKMS